MELYDADLLAFGVQLTHDLDRAFSLPPKVTAAVWRLERVLQSNRLAAWCYPRHLG